MGATYHSVYRGVSRYQIPYCKITSIQYNHLQVPAVAFSAGNGTHRSFTTNTGAPDDPANIAARLTANFVNALANGTAPGQRLMPIGVGIG
jgi:hypothetical protein